MGATFPQLMTAFGNAAVQHLLKQRIAGSGTVKRLGRADLADFANVANCALLTLVRSAVFGVRLLRLEWPLLPIWLGTLADAAKVRFPPFFRVMPESW